MLTANGAKRYEAYLQAGYEVISTRGEEHQKKIAGSRATKLMAEPKVKARVAELENEMRTDSLARAKVDRGYVLENLKQNSERAQAAVPVMNRLGKETGTYKQDISGSNRALELMGKEVGMFQDRFDESGLDERIAKMTVLEVRAAIRAAATEVGLRMVEMDDTQLRTFILVNAPRVGLRCVEESAGDSGSGEAPEAGSLPAISEASGVPSTQH